MNHPSLPHAEGPARAEELGRANTWTLIVAGFGLFLLAVGFLSSGIGGAVVMAALLALFTGVYTVLTGRQSWARLPGRKAGAILTAASVVVMLAAGTLIPSTGDTAPAATDGKTATPTEESATEEASEPAVQPSVPEPSPSTDVAPDDEEDFAKVPQPPASTDITVLALLETLPIKGRAPKTGYDRDQFGQAWLDVDRNGCDTRNDMLNRDLRDVVHANSVPCKVSSGTLDDPYTGITIGFLRGQDTSSEVQIDHVVALADAWQKGAQQLTFEQRVAFANDPLNLQATDGPTNQQKGAGDAATWLPPNRSFRCEYVARQISVKATYSLWVTQAEHDAMARVLTNCPDTMAPTSQSSPAQPPAPPPVPTQAPVPAPEPAPASAPYPNCAAARSAGAAPVHRGQPGYGSHLDGDDDGVGCE